MACGFRGDGLGHRQVGGFMGDIIWIIFIIVLVLAALQG